MAISYDTKSNSDTGFATATSKSVNHTVAATATILVAGVMWNSSTATLSSCAYNSVNMTQIGSTVSHSSAATSNGANTQMNLAIFYTLSPTSGTHAILASCSAAANIAVGGITLIGTNTTGSAINTSNTGNGATTPGTLSLTTTADNCWTISFCSSDGYATSTPTAASGQTNRASTSTAGNDNFEGATLGPITPAGAQTLSWTLGAFNWVESAVAILPGVSVTPSISSWGHPTNQPFIIKPKIEMV